MFQVEINWFLENVKSLTNTLPLFMVIVSQARKATKDSLAQFIKRNKEEIDNQTLHRGKISDYRNKIKNYKDYSYSCSILPRSYIVSLVSQYDAYISKLMRVLFNRRPEMLHASSQKVCIADLLKFETLEEVKELLIEKEIDSLLRENHHEQLKWFENQLNKVKVIENCTYWKSFIEVAERRNLFVHCDGVVSAQYIGTCKKNGIDLANTKKGDTLFVTPDYFFKASECFFEVGVKLGYCVWRKMCPDESEQADEHLNIICYDLIQEEKYSLAISLLDYAIALGQDVSSHEMLLTFVINKAQSHKWLGEEKQCCETISHFDWSAYKDKFLLARHVLLDDFDSAAELMRQIGINGDIAREDYIEWPLFSRFRESDNFRETFRDVFGEEYRERSLRNLHKITLEFDKESAATNDR